MNFLISDTGPGVILEILALRATYYNVVKDQELHNSFSEALETNGRGERKEEVTKRRRWP